MTFQVIRSRGRMFSEGPVAFVRLDHISFAADSFTDRPLNSTET